MKALAVVPPPSLTSSAPLTACQAASRASSLCRPSSSRPKSPPTGTPHPSFRPTPRNQRPQLLTEAALSEESIKVAAELGRRMGRRAWRAGNCPRERQRPSPPFAASPEGGARRLVRRGREPAPSRRRPVGRRCQAPDEREGSIETPEGTSPSFYRPNLTSLSPVDPGQAASRTSSPCPAATHTAKSPPASTPLPRSRPTREIKGLSSSPRQHCQEDSSRRSRSYIGKRHVRHRGREATFGEDHVRHPRPRKEVPATS